MLITTTEEIQKYIPVSVASSFETIKPYVESSERKFIKEILGYKTYKSVVDYYNYSQGSGSFGSDTDERNVFAELLGLIQRSLINLAYYHGFAILAVQATNGGFVRIENDTYKGLYKYQDEELKALFKGDGFNGMDDILEFLEENIEYFSDFEKDANRLVNRKNIIPDTKTMDGIYGIDGSRLVFLKLTRFRKQVEDFTLKSVLGVTLYNDVKTELAKSEPSERVVNLLPYLRDVVAYLSVATGIDELGINITDKMVYFESQAATLFNSKLQNPVEVDRLASIKNKAEKVGTEYLEALKKFLIDNTETYPEYSGQKGSVYKRKNTGKKTYVA